MANVKSKIKIWILLGIAFVILVAALTFMLSHDLSGSYQTNEFFPVTRITFFMDGKVTAQNMISSDLTEVYQGTYQKNGMEPTLLSLAMERATAKIQS